MTLQDRPTAAELLEAVREFLARDVMPALDGRLAFHTRVAVNAITILEREMTQSPGLEASLHARLRAMLDHQASLPDLTRELASAIRDGSLDTRREETVAMVRDLVRAKLEVTNPGYLA